MDPSSLAPEQPNLDRADRVLDDGVDVTLIRWMLSLSPEQRLDVLQSFLDSIAELTDEEAADQRQGDGDNTRAA